MSAFERLVELSHELEVSEADFNQFDYVDWDREVMTMDSPEDMKLVNAILDMLDYLRDRSWFADLMKRVSSTIYFEDGNNPCCTHGTFESMLQISIQTGLKLCGHGATSIQDYLDYRAINIEQFPMEDYALVSIGMEAYGVFTNGHGEIQCVVAIASGRPTNVAQLKSGNFVLHFDEELYLEFNNRRIPLPKMSGDTI